MAANFSPTVATGSTRVGPDNAIDATFSWSDPAGRAGLIALLAFVGGLTLAYWRVLHHTSAVWVQPQYSHGWIVPLIGAYLMWCRRPNQTPQSRPFSVDLGIIEVDFTLVVGAVLVGAAAYFGGENGVPMLPAIALSAFCAGVIGWVVSQQPFSPQSKKWVFDLEDHGERVLLGCTVAASVMVGLTYSGMLPQQYHSLVMLGALLLYGVSLLGVSLTARSGPLPRTGSETLAATAALIGTSLIWIQGSQLDMMPIMRICYIVSLLGAFGLVGGRRLLRWAGPAVVFIVFMYPLPSIVEQSLLPLLQKIAAIASTTVLIMMDIPVYREGSQMVLEGVAEAQRLDVAEACSGLRMSTIFGAMTVAMVFLINRPWWDKFTILLSAIPVALLVNVIRIVVTAIIYYAIPENDGLHKLVHDYAGFAMMPIAMGILWLELTILSNLSIEDDGIDYQTSRGGGGVVPRI